MTTEATATTPAAGQIETPPAAAVQPRTTVDQLPPEALSARLQQAKDSARRELLAELGIADIDSGKGAIAAARAAEEAKKSDAQRLAELQNRVAAQDEALRVAVARAQHGLSPEQKAAVDAIAGQDQTLWLKTYGALAATWGRVEPAVPPAPIPAPVAAPPVVTAPATTAPPVAAGAPPPPTATSPVDHAAAYASVRSANPFAAAAYLETYGEACLKK